MTLSLVERLSPLDLLMPGGYVGAVFVFPTTESPGNILPRLQSTLELVCERVPWLKGRLVKIPPTHGRPPTLELQWCASDPAPQILDKGPLDKTYTELARDRVPHKAIPIDIWPTSAGVSVEDGSETPGFAASFFHFQDGKAVGLCVQGHHNIMDGYGFAEIVGLWSRYLNGSQPQIPAYRGPDDRKNRLSAALGEHVAAEAASASLDQLFEKHPEHSKTPPAIPTESSACAAEMMTIPMSKIDALKESLKAYTETRLTTNTIACTLLWSAITRTRMQRTRDLDGKSSRLPMAVNGRGRLGTDLTDGQNPYLGNVVLFSLAEMGAPDVRDCGKDGSLQLLANACEIVAKAQSVERIDATHIGEVCAMVNKLDDHRKLFPGWELFGSRDLFITSWADLDVYSFDFGEGLGRPAFVRIPYAQADGNVIVLPRNRTTPEADAAQGVEVVVMLRKEDLELLKKDSLWQEP